MLLGTLEHKDGVDVLNTSRFKLRVGLLLPRDRIVSRERHRVVNVVVIHRWVSNWGKLDRPSLLLRSVNDWLHGWSLLLVVVRLVPNLLGKWHFLLGWRWLHEWKLDACVVLGSIQVLIVGASRLRWGSVNALDTFASIAPLLYDLLGTCLTLRLPLLLRLVILWMLLILTEEALRDSDWTSWVGWHQVIVRLINFIGLVENLLYLNIRLGHLVDRCGGFGTFIFVENWSLLLGDRRCVSIQRCFWDGSLLRLLNRLLLENFLPRAILVVASLFLSWDTSDLLALRWWGDSCLLPLKFLIGVIRLQQVMKRHIPREVICLNGLVIGVVCHHWPGLVSVVGSCTFQSLNVLVHVIW